MNDVIIGSSEVFKESYLFKYCTFELTQISNSHENTESKIWHNLGK